MSLHTKSEKGAVLIVFLVFIAALTVLAAFAIDFARIFTSDAELSYLAERAVIAAMEAALEETGGGAGEEETFERKVDAAVLRLAEILELSPNRIIGNWGADLSQGSSQTTDVHIPSSYNVDPAYSATQGSYTETSDTSVWLEVGNYYWDAPDSCPGTCPCSRSSWEGPCFETKTFAGGTTDYSFNAIKLEIATPQTSRFQGIFSRMFAWSETNIRQSAIAAIPSLYLQFFVDLSRSMKSTNYLPHEAAGPPAGEYAYQIDPASAIQCSGTAGNIIGGDHSNPCLPSPHGCNIGGPPIYAALYNQEPDTRGTPYAPGETTHFKDDYECFSVDLDKTGPRAPENYLISQNIANPLGIALQTIHEAMTKLSSEAGSSKVGAMFFTDDVYPLRRFKLSSPGESDFESLLRISDVSDASTRFERNISGGLFPEVDAHTDYAGALLELEDEVREFADSGNVHVIFIGDGIATCQLTGTEPWTSTDEACNKLSYGGHKSANNQIETILPRLVQIGVKFHTALIGDHIQPNYGLYKGVADPSKCMDLSEMKEEDLDIGAGKNDKAPKFLNQSAATPYHFPNYFWSEYAAKLSEDNQFWTVQEPCNPSAFTNPNTGSAMTQAECEAGDLEDYMHSQCDSHGSPGSSVSIPGISDSISGFVSCNPSCLPQEVQLNDYMDKFFKSIVVRLVKE